MEATDETLSPNITEVISKQTPESKGAVNRTPNPNITEDISQEFLKVEKLR